MPPAKEQEAMQDIAALADDVRSGNRRALAQAITLVESTRPDHRAVIDSRRSVSLHQAVKNCVDNFTDQVDNSV